MAAIRQEDVEAVKERTDIVQLVGQYLTLKKAGPRLADRPVSVPPGEDAPRSACRPPSRSSTASDAARAATRSRSSASSSTSPTSRRSSGSRRRPGVTLRYEGDSRDGAPRGRAPASRCYRANEQAAALFPTMLARGKEAADARAYVTERGITRRVASRPSRSGTRRLPGLPAAAARRSAISSRDPARGGTRDPR